MAQSRKDYEQEGWNKKASQYERVTLTLTNQGFEPILASFGDLTGKRPCTISLDRSRRRMSAIPPTAAEKRTSILVRFVPFATKGTAAKPRYSITSSARASSAGGTVRPIDFAVLILMTSSYLVGCCTGKSLGFSPLRMRST